MVGHSYELSSTDYFVNNEVDFHKAFTKRFSHTTVFNAIPPTHMHLLTNHVDLIILKNYFMIFFFLGF